MSGHYKLNPPPYKAGGVKFFGVPGSVGEILTDERLQAFGVIQAFGKQGSDQQTYVTFFFSGKKDASGAWSTPPQPNAAQLGDIGSFFTLDATQAKAINNGTSATRAEFLAGASATGLDANNQPVYGVVAYQATTVSVGKVGSEYNKICADFQHNLAVAAR